MFLLLLLLLCIMRSCVVCCVIYACCFVLFAFVCWGLLLMYGVCVVLMLLFDVVAL